MLIIKGVPAIQSTWQAVLDRKCENAMELLLKCFQKNFPSEERAYEEVDLFGHYSSELIQVSRRFEEETIANPASSYHEKLLKSINIAFTRFLENNRVKSEELCRTLTVNFEASLGQIDSLDQCHQEILGFSKAYTSDSRGPAKANVLINILRSIPGHYDRLFKAVLAEMKLKHEREIEQAKVSHDKEYTLLKELYDSVNTERKKEEEASKRLRKECNDLKLENASLVKKSKDVEGLFKENETMADQLKKCEAEIYKLRESLSKEQQNARETMQKLEDTKKDKAVLEEKAKHKSRCVIQ
jgi:hypothetical protein